MSRTGSPAGDSQGDGVLRGGMGVEDISGLLPQHGQLELNVRLYSRWYVQGVEWFNSTCPACMCGLRPEGPEIASLSIIQIIENPYWFVIICYFALYTCYVILLSCYISLVLFYNLAASFFFLE